MTGIGAKTAGVGFWLHHFGIALMAIVCGIVCRPLVELALDYYHHYYDISSSSIPTIFSMTTIRQLMSGDGENGQEASRNGPTYPCTQETLQEYLTPVSEPGLFVVCVERSKAENGQDVILASVYSTDRKATALPPIALADWNAQTLQDQLAKVIPATQSKYPLPTPALFSPDGKLKLWIQDQPNVWMGKDLLDLGMGIYFAGGQWMWPGIKVGHVRTVEVEDYENGKATGLAQNVTLQTLSLRPLVLTVEGFLTVEECSKIPKAAEARMSYSAVKLMDKDKGRPASDFRTSQSTFLVANRVPTLRDLEGRVADLTRIPRSHQEHAQVLRYGLAEKYDLHHDYFDPSLYQQDERTLQTIAHGRRNRLVTVFWYLTDVEQGGETVFPRGPHGLSSVPGMNVSQSNYVICSGDSGVLVKPQAGKVILFYSLLFDGRLDSHSLHGACPVVEGTKWAANKWIWSEPMRYIRD